MTARAPDIYILRYCDTSSTAPTMASREMAGPGCYLPTWAALPTERNQTHAQVMGPSIWRCQRVRMGQPRNYPPVGRLKLGRCDHEDLPRSGNAVAFRPRCGSQDALLQDPSASRMVQCAFGHHNSSDFTGLSISVLSDSKLRSHSHPARLWERDSRRLHKCELDLLLPRFLDPMQQRQPPFCNCETSYLRIWSPESPARAKS